MVQALLGSSQHTLTLLGRSWDLANKSGMGITRSPHWAYGARYILGKSQDLSSRDTWQPTTLCTLNREAK